MADLNQVKDAYREGRFDQMWQAVLEISRSGHDELAAVGTPSAPQDPVTAM